MTGCLRFVVFVVLLLAALAWFALPPVADRLVTAGLGFVLGGTVEAQVDTAFPPSLLAFHADEVEVYATAVHPGGDGLSADSLRLDLRGVDLLARTAASVDGTLTGVTLAGAAPGGGPLHVASIGLAGPLDALDATVGLDGTEVRAVVAAALAQALGGALGGAAPDVPLDVTLSAPDRVRFTLAGVPADARLAVRSGSLVALFADGPVPTATILAAGATGPLALSGVRVDGSDLVLTGRLDRSALGL